MIQQFCDVLDRYAEKMGLNGDEVRAMKMTAANWSDAQLSASIENIERALRG